MSTSAPAPASSAAQASAGAARAAVSDLWVQLFVCLALASGTLSALRHFHPAAAPQAELASDEPPPAVGPEPSLPEVALPQPAAAEAAALAPAAAPGAAAAAAVPQAEGAGVTLLGRSKTPGRWIVDQNMGGGADRRSLAEALASAQDGDIIVVRPGTYKETLVVSRSVTVLGGGQGADEVVLESDGPLTVAVAGGKPAFKGLTISNSGGTATTALSVVKAEARLENVVLRSAGQGARVGMGSLTAAGGSFAARIALIAEDNGRLSVEGAQVAGTDVGALLKGDAIVAAFRRCRFVDSERAINIEGRSRLAVADSEFTLTGVGGGVFVFAGAQANVTKTTFHLKNSSRVGLYVHNATLEGSGVRVFESRRSGLIATAEASVTLDDAQFSRNGAAGVSAEKGASVTLRRATLSDNGDCGLQLSDATAVVDRSTLARDRCGAGFFGPGKLRVDRSRFVELALGPVAVSPGFEGRVKITGDHNEGFSPKKEGAGGGAGAAAPQAGRAQHQDPGRRRFSNDIFQRFEQRRRQQ
jgi:hypothetical protein